MVSLQEHIRFLRMLKIPYKKQLIKYLHHVFTQHAYEIRDLDKFIDEVMKQE